MLIHRPKSSFGDTTGQNKQTDKQTKNSESPDGSQVGANVWGLHPRRSLDAGWCCVCGGAGQQAADGTPAGGRTHKQRNIIAPIIPSYSFRDQYKRSLAHSPSPASSSTPLLCDSSFCCPHFRCFFFFVFFTNLALFFHFCSGVIVAAGAPSFTLCCTNQAQDLTPIVQTSGKEKWAVKAQFSLLKCSSLCGSVQFDTPYCRAIQKLSTLLWSSFFFFHFQSKQCCTGCFHEITKNRVYKTQKKNIIQAKCLKAIWNYIDAFYWRD